MANANNYALNGMTKPFTQRVIGLLNNVDGSANNTQTENSNQKPLIGFTLGAYLTVGVASTPATGFFIQAGDWIPAEKGRNLTLTIASGSGSLAVTSNGFDITVTLASGGSTAAAVVAAINAAFSASFVKATLKQGSAGGSNVATLAKTNFTTDQRYPALP